jgi:hypothetical protein
MSSNAHIDECRYDFGNPNSSDIFDRLRCERRHLALGALFEEAADEIKQLRAENSMLKAQLRNALICELTPGPISLDLTDSAKTA